MIFVLRSKEDKSEEASGPESGLNRKAVNAPFYCTRIGVFELSYGVVFRMRSESIISWIIQVLEI